jgi:hypothetical protein
MKVSLEADGAHKRVQAIVVIFIEAMALRAKQPASLPPTLIRTHQTAPHHTTSYLC